MAESKATATIERDAPPKRHVCHPVRVDHLNRKLAASRPTLRKNEDFSNIA